MAEASRGRVTITLGRSGQVVKRAGAGAGAGAGAASDVDFSDSFPGAGSKRSVRDRLGSNSDGPFFRGNQFNNKRQRGDGHTTSLNANGLNDVHIGKDDLRFKLMQKNVFRRPQSDDNEKVMDLREKLSRMGQPPLNSYEAWQQMPESRERMHDPRERMPEPRERMPESRERMPDSRERMPESRETSILGRIPSTRNVDDLPRMTSRSSYSPWTLDHLRQRSPDRVMGTSRGLSPPRNVDELQRRPLNRMYDDVRTVPFLGKDVLDAPRPVSTASFVTKSVLPPTPAKPMPPGPPIPTPIPPSSIVQKPPFSADEQQTVEGLLHSLGLGKYAILFKAEEVDMTALKQMGENDLKELGIPMGPRKKILLALLPRSKRQP